MALTVVGIFDNASEAQKAVDQLMQAGFSQSQVDVSTTTQTDETGSGELVTDRNPNTSGTRTEELVDDTKDMSSGIGNFFRSLFGDDDEDTKKYSTVGDRSSIVTVHAQTDDEAGRAAAILDDAGAVDVDERAATYGYNASAGTGVGDSSLPTASTDSDQTIKVIEENLEVGKRTVETGGVRLRSRIVSRPVEESIRLRQERVSVQRTPVDRPATAADLDTFTEGQIELTEHAEVPVVSKTAHVVEEVTVGKEVTQHDEVISDTVRKTEVDVENLGSTDREVKPDESNPGGNDVTYPAR